MRLDGWLRSAFPPEPQNQSRIKHAKLGPPNETQSIAGQKAYTWIVGNALYECRIRVVMAGDVVGTYEGTGDVNTCSQYGALSGGLKGYE
jgi:hypothetical protein